MDRFKAWVIVLLLIIAVELADIDCRLMKPITISNNATTTVNIK